MKYEHYIKPGRSNSNWTAQSPRGISDAFGGSDLLEACRKKAHKRIVAASWLTAGVIVGIVLTLLMLAELNIL